MGGKPPQTGLSNLHAAVDTKMEMNVPPPLASDAPPLLSPQPKPGSGKHRFFAILLSLCLGLFLADAAISFLDDLLIMASGCHAISVLRGLVAIATLLMSIALYGLIGLTPMVPKRFFLPLPFFSLATLLGAFPATIYFYSHLQQIALGTSTIQLALGIYILYRAQGRLKFRWPPVNAEQLGTRIFSWAHLLVFVLLNLFVLLPLVIIFLFSSTAHAVNRFKRRLHGSASPRGFTVQMRKYVRDDGKGN